MKTFEEEKENYKKMIEEKLEKKMKEEMPKAKLSVKWQLCIPKEVRLLLKAKPGDHLRFRINAKHEVVVEKAP